MFVSSWRDSNRAPQPFILKFILNRGCRLYPWIRRQIAAPSVFGALEGDILYSFQSLRRTFVFHASRLRFPRKPFTCHFLQKPNGYPLD